MNSHQQRMQRRFVLRVHARLAATIPGLIAGLYKKHHHEVPKKVFTDLGVFEPAGDCFIIKEIAPGWTVEEVQALSEATIHVDPDLKEVEA